jgi:hypothetical protein
MLWVSEAKFSSQKKYNLIYNAQYAYNLINFKAKLSPVTGCRGLSGCEMLRIPHCLDSRLIDGGEVVDLTRRPHAIPQNHFLFLF